MYSFARGDIDMEFRGVFELGLVPSGPVNLPEGTEWSFSRW